MNRPFRLGLDVDGVLADFNRKAAQVIARLTSRDLVPSPYREPNTWYWMQAYGYRPSEETRFWEHVHESATFWETLDAIDGAEETIPYVQSLIEGDDESGALEVYFLTTRPSRTAHVQTRRWLYKRGILYPQVCVCDSQLTKGTLAQALRLDGVVDDYPPNLFAVRGVAADCKVVLYEAPWNVEARAGLQAAGAVMIAGQAALRELVRAWVD